MLLIFPGVIGLGVSLEILLVLFCKPTQMRTSRKVNLLPGFSILYYLIPGYILSLGLSFFVPKIYTSIAFDAGGVASGPLTSGFILPMIIGVSYALRGPESVLEYGFGVVAMVAMTPLITIQVLGFRAVAATLLRRRIALKRIYDADDEQIIEFM